MTEPTFERRVHTWIEAGPSELPDDALGFIRAAIETVPQDRPPIRILRHVFPLVSLRAAAALVLFLVAGAAISFRFTGPDVANPRSPGDLLYAFPSAATVIERSGEAAGGTEVVTIGTLPTGRGFMLAGSCTGGAGVIARIYVPQGIQAGPSGVASSRRR